jgi:glycosyltransferase involved in cell wall biosynthesis
MGDLGRYKRKLWKREEYDGLKVVRVASIRLPRRFIFGRALWQFLLAITTLIAGLLMRKRDVCVVYSPPLPLGLSAWLIRVFKKTPFVFNVQDLFPHNLIETGLMKKGIAFSIFEKLEKFIYSRADRITVHAESNVDHILDRGGIASKVSAMSNWVDTDEIVINGSPEPFATQYNLQGCFIASFAGVLGHLQDLDVVLDAAEATKSEYAIKWLIVGDGVQRQRLEDSAKVRKLNNVLFVPMVPRNVYPQVLYASSVCLATLKKEVTIPVVPSKILSIMASGKPVVTCMDTEGDAPRLVRDADCGYTLPAGDGAALAKVVRTLHNDRNLGVTMGVNGRKYAESKLSLNAATEKYLAIFNNLNADTV